MFFNENMTKKQFQRNEEKLGKPKFDVGIYLNQFTNFVFLNFCLT